MKTKSATEIQEGWKNSKLEKIILEQSKSTIKVEDAVDDGEFPFFTSGEAVLSSNKYLVDGENLFLATGGVANVKYFNGKTSYSSDTYVLKTQHIDTKLLFYYLVKSLSSINYSFFSGSGLKHLQKKDFKKYSIQFPDKPIEQQKIAEILTTIDEAIEKTDAIIEKQKRVKQGLMQDLFRYGIDEKGNIRSEDTHKFKTIQLGIQEMVIPDEWGADHLKKLIVGNLRNGYFKKPELVGSGYRLINVSDIYQDFGIDTDKVERVEASTLEYDKNEVINGDCFFTRSSLVLEGIAFCNIIRKVKEPTIFECHVVRARPNKNMLIPEFLALWCSHKIARKHFMAMAKQVTMTTIDQNGIESLIVPLPSLPEQEEIIKKYDSSRLLIEEEEKYKEKLISLKRGLMGDLLTGEVRVSHLIN